MLSWKSGFECIIINIAYTINKNKILEKMPSLDCIIYLGLNNNKQVDYTVYTATSQSNRHQLYIYQLYIPTV